MPGKCNEPKEVIYCVPLGLPVLDNKIKERKEYQMINLL
jgi:hypothetical protein